MFLGLIGGLFVFLFSGQPFYFISEWNIRMCVEPHVSVNCSVFFCFPIFNMILLFDQHPKHRPYFSSFLIFTRFISFSRFYQDISIYG